MKTNSLQAYPRYCHTARRSFAINLLSRALRTGATVAIGCAAVVSQANTQIPPPPQSKPLLVTGATLHTMSGVPIVNGRMLIDKGRIVAIGTVEEIPDTVGADVIAMNGKHIYPGLIAANSALGLVEVQAVRATIDTAEAGAFNPNARALVAVNADSELIPVARSNGILATLTAPLTGPTGLIAGTSALIQTDGWTWETMGLIPEVGLHVSLPSMRFNPSLYSSLPAARLEEMQRLSTQRLKSLEEAFQQAAAYADAKAAEPALPIDVRWEAMRGAMRGERPVFIHADELPQIRHALQLAERFKLKLIIVGGYDAWRLADLLKTRNIPVILAGVHRLPLRRDDDIDAPFRLAAKLHAAGVKFAIARSGSAFDAATERSLPYEAATAVAYGLPREEAIKAITLYPAEIIGADRLIGSLQKGRLASFLVTDGDPLDIRTRVERIFIQGRELPLSDKHIKLNEKYQEKYRQLRSSKGG